MSWTSLGEKLGNLRVGAAEKREKAERSNRSCIVRVDVWYSYCTVLVLRFCLLHVNRLYQFDNDKDDRRELRRR